MADKGNFVVEVPISVKGGDASFSGGSGGGKGQDALLKGIKKLDKSIIATFDPLEILTQAFGDLLKLLQPLIKILSLLFLVIFLPLMPLIMLLVKGFAALVKLFTGGFGGVAAFIGKIILGILILALAIFLAPLAAEAAAIAGVIALVVAAVALFGNSLKDAIIFIGENIAAVWEKTKEAFSIGISFLADLGVNIWEFIKGGLSFIADLGVKIWNFFLTALEFIADLGVKIWNFFLGSLSFISNLGKMIWNFIKDSLSGIGGFLGFANGGRPPVGQASIVGERGPELFVPDSAGTIIPNGRMGSTININHPVVRNDQDIKKLANEISLVMQRQTKGRFSA